MDIAQHSVLVTGAGGFIGSHLVEKLLRAGSRVRALVHYNAASNWGWLDSLTGGQLKEVEVCAGDIRDQQFVAQCMQGIDVVFHLAALISIPFSYQCPASYVDTNIKGTLNVLESARSLGTGRLLITSTSEVYGTARYVPIDENHPFQGQSPYSASKIGADRLAESFSRSFGVPITIVRPFNTYGPRQSARAVIPTIIAQLLSGEAEIVVGKLSPTRDFNFVEDTVDGFVALAESDAAVGEEVNIASQVETSIGDLAKVLILQIRPEAKIRCDEKRMRPLKSEVERLLGSNEKIRRLTSWEPRFSLDQGLRKTIEWFRIPENLRRYKAHLLNL
jgi:NAD dependent epimerase/dehydratase